MKDVADPGPGLDPGGPAPAPERTFSTRASQQRWQAIIETAARMFAQQGYERTTVQDIAEAVGLLKGSVYYYIESKDDLLFAVLADHHRNVQRVRTVVEAQGGGPLERLGALLEAHSLANLEHPVEASVFHQDFRFLAGPRRETIVAQRDEYEQYLRDLIGEAQAAGLLRADLDAGLTAKLLLGALNAGHQWYRQEGSWRPGQIAGSMRDLLLGGLLAPGVIDPRS